MVFVDFMAKIRHNRFETLPVRNDASHLPDNVERVRIDFSPQVAARQNFSSVAITSLLRSSATKLAQISISGVGSQLSPEDLELLTTAFRNAKSITIEEWYSDDAYSCLESCLSEADGIEQIDVLFSVLPLSNMQAGHLFEGIKRSSCIKFLRLTTQFQDYRFAGNALLEALQVNQSLKFLYIDNFNFATESMLPDIFQAAIVDTRVKQLSIQVDRNSRFRHIPWSVWTTVLCQADCSVETLGFQYGIEITGPQDNLAVAQRNTSVTSFLLFEMNFGMTHIMQVCSVFQSLVSLNISSYNVSDLSPLDTLLIGGDDLTLRNLDLLDNMRMSHEHMAEFFRKLPRMAHIRKLEIAANMQLNGSNQWMDVLEDTIWQNKSLESLRLGGNRDTNNAYASRIDVALALNRGGKPRVGSLTENLFPLVLERAMKVSDYRSCERNARKPIQIDVVFGLLKEMVSFLGDD